MLTERFLQQERKKRSIKNVTEASKILKQAEIIKLARSRFSIKLVDRALGLGEEK